MMLAELFQEIIDHKKIYLSITDGQNFGDKIKNHLAKKYEVIFKDDLSDLEGISIKKANEIWEDLKEKITNQNSLEVVKNPFQKIKNRLVYQPYGSQNFPDFLVILQDYVIPVVVKLITNENQKIEKFNQEHLKAKWNFNFLQVNSLYIYGLADQDVTFFKGADILSQKYREALLEFWQRLAEGNLGEDFQKEMKKLSNPFTFYPYVRKDYAATYSYSSTNGEVKIGFENYFSANAKQREESVLNFLKNLN